MRVALVINGDPRSIGGVERVVSYLASALREGGHTAHVIGGATKTGTVTEDDNVRLVRAFNTKRNFGLNQVPLMLVGLGRVLTACAPDVVHVHGFPSSAAIQCAFWCRQSHVPLVVTPHTGAVYWREYAAGWKWPVMGDLLRSILSRAQVICVTDEEASVVEYTLGCKPLVIGNGVPRPEPLRPSESGTLCLVNASRAVPEKRLEWFLGVISSVARVCAIAGVLYLAPGDPEYESAVLAAGQSLQRSGFLSIVSQQAVNWTEIPRPAIYVSVSSRELYGMSMAEALVNGIPVVATDCEGSRFLLRRSGGGMIGHSVEELASLVVQMAEQGPPDSRFAERMRSLTVEETAWRHLDVYRSCTSDIG